MADVFAKELSLTNNMTELELLGLALSSPIRLEILKAIESDEPRKLYYLSKLCNVSLSSIQFHVDILVKAKLAKIEVSKKRQKEVKYVRSATQILHIDLRNLPSLPQEQKIVYHLPVGYFSDARGYGRSYSVLKDSRNAYLFDPEVKNASVVWLDKGVMEYRLSLDELGDKNVIGLEIGFECCSEAPGYNDSWPSDITIWINACELFTYTCPGDYGGRRGKYTPSWWPTTRTQHGDWNEIRIDENGTFHNGIKVSDITFSELNLFKSDKLSFSLGNKEDAKNKGGINLFGKDFGDYNSDIEFSFIRKE